MVFVNNLRNFRVTIRLRTLYIMEFFGLRTRRVGCDISQGRGPRRNACWIVVSLKSRTTVEFQCLPWLVISTSTSSSSFSTSLSSKPKSTPNGHAEYALKAGFKI